MRKSLVLLALAAAAFGCASSSPDTSASSDEASRRSHANILIADQFNNRVIEIDAHHNVVWSFGDGSSVAGPHSVVAPNDAQRVGSYTLIAGTGAPAGSEPSCTAACGDNRVMLVDHHGVIRWQYGKANVTGAGHDELNTPVCSVFLPSGNILITDQGNSRVIEVDADKNIVWQYGTTGTSGADHDQLDNPNSAELLDNGNILIADENNNRVIEVDRAKNILWSYGQRSDTTTLNGAAFASRLPNGNTLITDANNNRVVEVNAAKHVVFTFTTNTRPMSNPNPNPTRAIRLKSGNTLISDQNNHQVIEIDPRGKIVFTQGAINASGSGFNQLFGPYDAKVIGDYTGITSPTPRHAY